MAWNEFADVLDRMAAGAELHADTLWAAVEALASWAIDPIGAIWSYWKVGARSVPILACAASNWPLNEEACYAWFDTMGFPALGGQVACS